MAILITGSSGQIGTNLALRLLDAGREVLGVDIRPNTWTSRIPTVLHDLRDSSPRIDGGIDLVVHLAANAKVHELVAHPERAMDNVQTTFNVLDMCRQTNVPVIFSSSREVYGDIHRYLTDEPQADFAYTESPYSASKIAGEAFVYSYARCYGLRYAVFRFSNVYGRYDNDIERMERVLPLFIKRIAAGERITVYGREKVLDFTYVDDCVEGVVSAIDKLLAGERINQVINLAGGEGNTLEAAAKFIGEALGTDPKITFEPSRVGEVTHYVADISRAQELLGYQPKVQLREGLERAVAWSRVTA